VADTTELSNGSGPVPAASVAAGTESEREAASVAQVEVEPCIKVRRETEPVTTSLSTEEHSHASDNAQVSCVLKVPGFISTVVCSYVSIFSGQSWTEEMRNCTSIFFSLTYLFIPLLSHPFPPSPFP